MLDALLAFRKAGTTILLADQNANAVLRLADRAYVLDSGTVVAEGAATALLADKRLISAYLGSV